LVLAAAVLLALALWAFPRDASPPAGETVERFMHVHGLEIAPWAPDDVYVSTHHGLIRIDEAGEWRFVSETLHDFMGFSIHPQQEGVMYSSGHPAPDSDLQNPIGLMVSTDSGVTWEPRALEGQADFHAMAVQASDGDVIYGYEVAVDPGLHRSTDGGQTWERIPAGQVDEVGALALAVHPDDRDRVLAATEAGLLESQDGGRTWEPLVENTVTTVAYAFDDADRIVAYELGRGLIASDDGGATWEPIGWTAPVDDAAGHIAPHPEDPDIIYVGTLQEGLFRTSDGGTSWEQLAEGGRPLTPQG
jgi:hypothetical protein